jgi:hypothetical protein
MLGISATQGGHHVAQKLRNTTFPFAAAILKFCQCKWKDKILSELKAEGMGDLKTDLTWPSKKGVYSKGIYG